MSVTSKPPQMVSLTAGNSYGSIAAPTELVAASVNGDGIVDLIIYETEGSQTIAVLKGDGDGTFGAEQRAMLLPNYVADFFAVGDIDSDTKLDIAVQEHSPDPSDVTVVELGLGGGAFGTPSTIPSTNSPSPIILADINHDGFQDIVRATSQTHDDEVNGKVSGQEIELILGNGDGSFRALQGIAFLTTGFANGIRSFAAADFDGDGRMDLAVAGFNTMMVLHQNVGGTFSPAATITNPTGMATFEVVAADINNDGRADLVIGEGSVNNGYAVTVAISNADGSFQTPIVTAVNGYTGNGIAVADMNGDGRLDVVITTQSGSGVDILLGIGNGHFFEQDNVGPFGGDSITTGDFNGDGKPDVAVGNHDGFTVDIMLNTTPHITTRTITAADGSTYVFTYSDGHLIDLLHSNVPGQYYVTQETVYSLDGMRTSSVRTNANGSVASTFSIDHDTGDQVFVNNDLSYRSVTHMDMTRDVYFYDILGKSYADDHQHYDASGTLDHDTRTTENRIDVYTYDRNATTGVETTDKYDKFGVPTFHEVSSAADGTDTTTYTNGVATNETIVHADGTEDVYVHGVQGKSYTDDHRHYDACGVLDEQTRTHGGTDDYTYMRDANTGVETTDRYDSSGVRTSHLVVDGDESDSFTYTGGNLVREVQIHGDQTKDIFLSNVTGKLFTAEHDSYDANGIQLSTDQTLDNTSHSQKAFAAGVTLVSTGGGVVDAMKSATAGDDTFQFGSSFGHDTITGFHAGDGANHDVLDFSHSSLQRGDLTVAASGQHDTLITLDAGDSILLKGVSALTDQDFLFGSAAAA